MLNGVRRTWYYRNYVRIDEKVYQEHRVVPSTRNFSSITNNNYGTAAALALIPTAMLITAGVLFVVFANLLAGIAFLAITPTPLVAVLIRYFSAYPHKGGTNSKYAIDRAETAFSKMSLDKQKEYTKYLEAIYAENIDADEVINLFKTCADKNGIRRQVKDELEVQTSLHKILGE